MPRAGPLGTVGSMLQAGSELEDRLKAALPSVYMGVVYIGWPSFLAYCLFSKCPLNAPTTHKCSTELWAIMPSVDLREGKDFGKNGWGIGIDFSIWCLLWQWKFLFPRVCLLPCPCLPIFSKYLSLETSHITLERLHWVAPAFHYACDVSLTQFSIWVNKTKWSEAVWPWFPVSL